MLDRLPCKMIVVDGVTALVPVHVDWSGLEPSAAILHGPPTRRLTRLMQEAGVSARFQLAFHAGHNGWLDADMANRRHDEDSPPEVR